MNYRKTNEHKRLNFLVGSPLTYHIFAIYIIYILGVGVSYIIHIYNLLSRTFQVGWEMYLHDTITLCQDHIRDSNCEEADDMLLSTPAAPIAAKKDRNS